MTTKKKQTTDTQTVETPQPQLQPGTNILTAKTREELCEQADALTATDGHLIFGAVGFNVEKAEYTLRVDYLID